jgi:hypothetical protein
MRFTTRITTRIFGTVEDTGCRHTLVVHADGTHECEGAETCGSDELVHDWWLPCDELGCGCIGEEHDLGLVLAAAA